MQNYLYNPCTAYCALSASDNSRVGFTTLLFVTYWLCITNQYNHYKNNFVHLLRYINNNLPVITCIDTEIDTPYKVQGVHSITIVASDNNYYYCAYGGTDVVRIPHSAIGIYPLYVTTGLK